MTEEAKGDKELTINGYQHVQFFNGTEDVHSWVETLEFHGIGYKWSGKEFCVILPLRLVGPARIWYRMFIGKNVGLKASDEAWALTRAAFIRQFALVEDPGRVYDKLRALRQYPNETVNQFNVRFYEIVQDRTDVSPPCRLAQLYCDGLKSPILERVKNNWPEIPTVQAVQDLAVKYDIYPSALPANTNCQVYHTQVAPSSEDLQHQIDELHHLIQDMTLHVRRVQEQRPQDRPQDRSQARPHSTGRSEQHGRQFSSGRGERPTLSCFLCDGPHLIRNCPVKEEFRASLKAKASAPQAANASK